MSVQNIVAKATKTQEQPPNQSTKHMVAPGNIVAGISVPITDHPIVAHP